MVTPPPPGLTGRPHIDRVLAGLVRAGEAAAPGQVLAYYLTGSYAGGTPVATSDVDIVAVVRPRAGAAVVAGLRSAFRSAGRAGPVKVDSHVCRTADLAGPSLVALCRAGVLLHGTDVRGEVRPLAPADFLRRTAHNAFEVVTRGRPAPGRRYPLAAVDPAGPWLGFDRRRIRWPDGRETPGLQELVTSTSWAARALVLMRVGEDSAGGSGSRVVSTCLAALGGRWGGLLEGVYRRCRDEWQYGIPGRAADRHDLRRMCEEGLAFQNFYLGEYRTFVLNELGSKDIRARRSALNKLVGFSYPGSDVRSAVERVVSLNGPLKTLAREALLRADRE